MTVDETSATPITFYVNGAPDGTPAYAGTLPSSGTEPLQIGNYGQLSGGVFPFNGTVDEVRISSVARTGDWMRAEYNNQRSPSTFYAVGAEQSGPGFTLSLGPASPASVNGGGTTTATATITAVNGFSSAVTLSTLNWPTGITGTFSPSAATSTSTLTVSVASTMATGVYSLPIRGSASGVNSQNATLILQVQGVGTTCGNSYLYCRSITIDHTKVGGSDSSNFPVLISGTYSWMATTANGGRVVNTVTQTGAGSAITVPADLVFTSDAACATPLSWEYE